VRRAEGGEEGRTADERFLGLGLVELDGGNLEEEKEEGGANQYGREKVDDGRTGDENKE